MNTRRPAVTLLVAWVACAPIALCQTPQQAVTLSLAPLQTKPLTTYKGHENEILHERRATLDLGDARYAITYKAGYNDDIPDRAFPLEGYIGMPVPTPCNWYHSGFLWVLLDGKDVGTIPLSSMTIAEEEQRGTIDLVWHHEIAHVRARFVGLAGTDCVFCHIAVEPRRPIGRLAIRTRCYPSFFTAHHNRVGARRIRTPNRLVKEGEKPTLNPAENWWFCYYDEVFDVAKGDGAGPCAMMLLPHAVERVHCKPGGYAVDTVIEYKPDCTDIKLAFWDLKGRTNKQALDDMRQRAQTAKNTLETLDTTPAIIRSADLRELRQELNDIAQSDIGRKLLGKQLENVSRWLRDLPQDLPHNQSLSVKAQENLLRSHQEIQSVIWEARLAKLLTEF